jgi:hypothetical protein
MIRKSGYRFSEKIIIKQQAKAKYRVNHFALSRIFSTLISAKNNQPAVAVDCPPRAGPFAPCTHAS